MPESVTPKVIPVEPIQNAIPVLPIPQSGPVRRVDGHWRDELGRPLRDLRISVTDHCNFRCRYCMPKESFSKKHHFLAMTELIWLRMALLAVGFACAGIWALRHREQVRGMLQTFKK